MAQLLAEQLIPFWEYSKFHDVSEIAHQLLHLLRADEGGDVGYLYQS